MIVRYEQDDGRQTEASAPGPVPDGVTPEDLARGLLSVMPGVRRIQVWADGLSFLDPPSAEAWQEDAEGTAEPSSAVLDVATVLMLTGHGAGDGQGDGHDGAPEWLRPWRARVRPYVGPGRPTASGTLPPV